MKPQQEEHLDYILAKATLLIDAKYRKGQAEKGENDNLADKSPEILIDEAIDEAVDQMVYLLTARKKLKDFLKKYDLHGPTNSGHDGVAGQPGPAEILPVGDIQAE
jgi:hypothetical protein